MTFASPYVLLLLIPAVILACAEIYSFHKWLRALIRAGCLCAAIVSLAGPLLRLHREQTVTVLVLDVGPSISAADLDKVSNTIQSLPKDLRIIAYSNRATVLDDASKLDGSPLAGLRRQLGQPQWSDDPIDGGSNLQSALQLAGAQIPEDSHGKILLHTAGLITRGDAEAEAYRLAHRGIAIETTELTPVFTDAGFVVRGLSVPTSAKMGQTVQADITIEASKAEHVQLAVGPSPQAEISLAADLAPGLNHLSAQIPMQNAGLIPIHVTAKSATPTTQAAVHVGPPSRILIVRDQGTAASDGFDALLGNSAMIQTISPESLDHYSLDGISTIVLDDIPAAAFSPPAIADLQSAVGHGAGLLLTGATRSFGPGGYADSPLASLMPITMPQQAESIDPSVALVLVIDTSGSMSDDGKLDLAKSVARVAISHLRPQDKIGIVEFYGTKRWAAPIQSASHSAVINRALGRLTASGSTTLFPAVEEAAFGLHAVRARSKHVLILSDGFVENAPFAQLARRMADDGVMISTVCLGGGDGDGGEQNQMSEIARAAGGRYYTVPDRFALPDLSFKQPEPSLLSPFVRDSVALVSSDDYLMRPYHQTNWQLLRGYVRTVAKPTADVLLKTAGGDPLLVRWRYGAGFVATLPTQTSSDMTAAVQKQPEFAGLISSLFRQIGNHEDAFVVRPTVRSAGVEIAIDAATDEGFQSQSILMIRATDSSGKLIREIQTEPAAPGKWNVLLSGLDAGAYDIAVEAKHNSIARGHAAFAIPMPRPFPRLTSDSLLLAKLESFAQTAAQQAAALPKTIPTYIDLKPFFLITTVVTLILHVALRRRSHA